MAANVDEHGVLADGIVQVSQESPAFSSNSAQCQVKIKGPYDVLKDCNNLAMCDLATSLSRIPLTISKEFEYPAAPAGAKWWVTSTSLEQLESGSHGMLTLVCQIEAASYNPGTQSGSFDPYQDTWQLRWESYTVKPAAFCSNDAHAPNALTAATDQALKDQYASRQYVNYFIDAGKDNSGYLKDKGWYWYRNDGGEFALNNAESLVLQKTLADKTALYHYPVLTHVTTKVYDGSISSIVSTTLKYSDGLGENVDYLIEELPSSCPYTFSTILGQPNWQWIKTGDDMQHIKTKDKISFQRTETYMGVISADINFYGREPFDHSNLSACRWKIGEL